MPILERIAGLEILDSRGRPTVKAICIFNDGSSGTASIPSGASTGAAEAHELRDGDPTRYGGLGCRKAVANLNTTINDALRGQSFTDQHTFDQTLIELDGTPNKATLGANAILAASVAFARAVSNQRQQPLYQTFAVMLGGEVKTLPRPMINLFSGGKHAGGQVDIQDVQVMPLTATRVDDLLATTYAVYQAAARLIKDRFNARALSADEGGLAPPFPNSEAMLKASVEAIEAAGFRPGDDVGLTLDVAASHFFADGMYHLEDERLDGMAMVERVAEWVSRYPIVSVEDGLAEDDWQHWTPLRDKLRGKALTLGDDLLCTNPIRIQRAIDTGAADALLLKVNQIGTLTEAAHACKLAKDAGWRVVVSARSGETEDDWLADLAVGWAGDHIKVGSITQSERLAKYNRLLEIEAETELSLST